jgi:Holliday junction resolvase-like predicted endonuclease
MDRYEEAVMHYLTANGATLVVHQYSIGQGWACPDFVAIRLSAQCICVVEVSTAWDLTDLAQRIKNRQVQWWGQLIPHFQQYGVIAHGWRQRVAVFIRQDRVAWFQQAIGNAPDGSVIPLESILAAWNWPAAVWTPQFNPCFP